MGERGRDDATEGAEDSGDISTRLSLKPLRMSSKRALFMPLGAGLLPCGGAARLDGRAGGGGGLPGNTGGGGGGGGGGMLVYF